MTHELHTPAGDDVPRLRPSAPDPGGLDALFRPDSVAIIGASDDTSKYGNWIAVQAVGADTGTGTGTGTGTVPPVHLVNHRRSTVLGQRAYPRAVDIGARIDLAVLTVPAAGLEDAVEDALAAGARALVAITGGMGEMGEEGKALERRITARALAAGARLLGPNCLGIVDHAAGVRLAPNSFPVGDIAVISQSGNIALEIAGHLKAAGLGLSRFASLGNQADIDAAELIESCVADPNTGTIAVYCEDFRDGRRFARAALNAREAGKALVLLTVGGTDASARNARSHTGALATSASVVAAVCEAAGIEQVTAPSQVADLLVALAARIAPRGHRVAVLADGGGHASIASDVLAERGLDTDEFSPELRDRIARELPPTASVANPIDVAGGGEQDIACFARVLDNLADGTESDATVLSGYFGGYALYGEQLAAQELDTARRIVRAQETRPHPLFVQTMHPGSPAAQILREGRIPVYGGIREAAWALSRVSTRTTAQTPWVPPVPEPAPAEASRDYLDIRAALAASGLSFPAACRVTGLGEALAFAEEHGYPVVLKALGDEHKSDRGGVKLFIDSEHALARAWNEIRSALDPAACSVERMVTQPHAVELIVGSRWDTRFGPMTLVGLGGIYAEVFRDVRVALGPVDLTRALEMLRSLRGSALLAGVRGNPPVDLDAASAAVRDLSRFAASHPEFAEVECNPIQVSPDGAIALDARAVWASAQHTERQRGNG